MVEDDTPSSQWRIVGRKYSQHRFRYYTIRLALLSTSLFIIINMALQLPCIAIGHVMLLQGDADDYMMSSQ